MSKYIGLKTALIMTLASIVLSACGAGTPVPPDSSRIQADIVENADFLPEELSVRSVTVFESDLDSRSGVYAITVEIRASGGDVTQRFNARVVYTLGDGEQWELREIEQIRRAGLPVAPTSGVRESDISAVLLGLPIDVDGEQWLVDYQSIESIVVSGRDTQLDRNRESLLITLRLRDEVLVASGQMQLEYIYDDEWLMTDCQIALPFTTSSREGMEHELHDEDAMEEILSLTFPYGSGGGQQSISISSGEVSDFTADQITLRNKGHIREYSYSFVLDKKLAAFNVSVAIEYQYDKENGWVHTGVTVEPAVFSVNLEATVWSGEHSFQRTQTSPVEDPQPMTLEITYEEPSGTIHAALSYDVDDVTIAQRLSGTLDWDTLTLDLQFSRWVSERYSGEGYFTDYQKSFIGHILIDDLILKSAENADAAQHAFELVFE